MYDNVDIRDLQRATGFIMIKKRLKTMGISSILFGLFAIYIGNTNDSITARVAISSIGIYLIIEGLWAVMNPSPIGILMDCLGFIAVGLWYSVASLTGSMPTFILILGLLQIKWSFDRYKEYKIFSKMAAEKPTPESMILMESAVKDILARDVNSSNDIIEMRLKGVVWRVLLIERAAIFVAASGRGVFVQNREDVSLTLQPGAENAKIVTVIGDVTSDLPAEMPADHYRRYLVWKGISDQSAFQSAPRVDGAILPS